MDNNKWYFLYDLQVQRHQEDLANAEQYRLALQTEQIKPVQRLQRRMFLRRFLYALGSRLMTWGCRLQSIAG